MSKLIIKDKHIAFVNDVAAGGNATEAYLKHIARTKSTTKGTAAVAATRMLQRPEVVDMVARVKAERESAIVKAKGRELAREFSGILLTTDELDQFHCSIIQGLVDVEEVVVGYSVEEVLNDQGKIVKRIRKPMFNKVKRPPNIREKQVSVDALYKRRGDYAPAKIAGMFKNADPDETEIAVDRFIVLANGERIPLP